MTPYSAVCCGRPCVVLAHEGAMLLVLVGEWECWIGAEFVTATSP